jgi:nucleoside-diphosphate-sugar epimerase
MMTEDSTHVIFGTGPLGKAVMRALVADGQPVRMVNRSGRADVPTSVEVVAADLYRPDDVQRVTSGASVVYQTAQPAYTEWAAKFPPLIAAILDGLNGSGARLVLGDNLYMADNTGGAPIMENGPVNAVTRKGKVRAQCAELVFAAHRAGSLKAAAVRGSDFYGPEVLGSMMGDMAFTPLLAGKRISLVGSADLPHTYTYIDDFGRAMAGVGGRESAMGRVWHVPTPGPLQARAFLQQAAQVAGVDLKLGVVPPLMLRAAALFSPFLREVVEMQYQFRQPYIVDSREFVREFGDISTPRETALRETIAWFKARNTAAASH